MTPPIDQEVLLSDLKGELHELRQALERMHATLYDIHSDLAVQRTHQQHIEHWQDEVNERLERLEQYLPRIILMGFLSLALLMAKLLTAP